LVLLANGNLVKEGVDLLEFPTIVEVGQHYIITNLQQRLRRSWRLGQTKEVRLYYLFYAGTLQEQAIHRIAKKLKAAKQIDGRVAEGLADYGDDEDFIQDLMRAAQTLEGGRIAELMQVRVIEDRNKPVFGSNGSGPKPVVIVPEPVGETVQLSLF
jgi:hypothetical protein